MRFLSRVWHPNVYENGDLCISILHPPVDDPRSGELASERWNPTQNVRTILLSVISLLNEPNTQSPANVDASVMYRKWREGKDDKYKNVIREHVAASRDEAAKDGVNVPQTVEEYCRHSVDNARRLRDQQTATAGHTNHEFDMDFDDHYYDYGDDNDSGRLLFVLNSHWV